MVASFDTRAITARRLQGAERFDEFSERIRKFLVVAKYKRFTIGWFYQQIASAMCDLEAKELQHDKTLFVGDSARQVVWPSAPGHLFRITDLRSALGSILEIITKVRGHRASRSPEPARARNSLTTIDSRRSSRAASSSKNGKWVFEGPAISFDPDGVYPMIDDPDTSALPSQSRVREASLLCDRVYCDLLTALDWVFDGHPETLDSLVSLMFSLRVQAKKLLTMPTSPGAGTVVGPSFQVLSECRHQASDEPVRSRLGSPSGVAGPGFSGIGLIWPSLRRGPTVTIDKPPPTAEKSPRVTVSDAEGKEPSRLARKSRLMRRAMDSEHPVVMK
jgi:hypothetical protein